MKRGRGALNVVDIHLSHYMKMQKGSFWVPFIRGV